MWCQFCKHNRDCFYLSEGLINQCDNFELDVTQLPPAAGWPAAVDCVTNKLLFQTYEEVN